MDLELTILNYLREKEFYNKLAPFINEETLSENGKVIFSSVKELMERCPEDGKLKCKEIHLYLSSDSSYSKGDLRSFKDFLKGIRNSRVSNRGVLIGICKEFLEKNLWKDALEKFMPYLGKKGIMPLDPVEEALDTTKKIRESFGETKGYDFFENISRSKVKDSPGAVESPLKGIFLYPGEVGLWAGTPKKGKTWALINTAYSALIQGRKILYFTLELPADWVALRLDGRILGKPYKEVNLEDSARAVKKIKSLGGSLIIEDRPELTLYEIRNYIKSDHFDLVIVDYADLMSPPKKYKEKRFELTSIFQGLRRIAKEFKIPVWTASQLTAKSLSKKVATIEDLEEAKIGKAGTCSLVLTINQDLQEREDGIARVFVAASSRYISGRSLRKVESDFDKMLMREIEYKKKEKEKEE